MPKDENGVLKVPNDNPLVKNLYEKHFDAFLASASESGVKHIRFTDFGDKGVNVNYGKLAQYPFMKVTFPAEYAAKNQIVTESKFGYCVLEGEEAGDSFTLTVLPVLKKEDIQSATEDAKRLAKDYFEAFVLQLANLFRLGDESENKELSLVGFKKLGKITKGDGRFDDFQKDLVRLLGAETVSLEDPSKKINVFSGYRITFDPDLANDLHTALGKVLSNDDFLNFRQKLSAQWDSETQKVYVDPRFNNPTSLKAWLEGKADLHPSQTRLQRLGHNLDALARDYAFKQAVSNPDYSEFSKALDSLKSDDFVYSVSLKNGIFGFGYYGRKKDSDKSFFRSKNSAFLKNLFNADPVGYDRVWFKRFFPAFLKILEKDERLKGVAVKEFLLHWLCHPSMDFDTLDVSTKNKINEWLCIEQPENK